MTVYVKSIRESKGISLRELSEISGVSRSNLYYIENGTVYPNIDTLCKIANVLGVPASELFSCDDE